MTEHLDQQTLSAFRQHRLAGSAVLAVATHIGGCRQCAAAAGRDSGELIEALAPPDEGHLSEDTVFALADRTLSGEPKRAAEAHLEACANCQAEVDDLRSFRDAAMPAPWTESARRQHVRNRSHRSTWGAVAAAACLAIVIGTTALVRREPVSTEASRQTAGDTITTNPTAAPAVRGSEPVAARITLRDGDETVTLYTDGTVDGVPAQTANLVRTALTTSKLPEASILLDLTPVASVLRGPTSEAQLAVLQPVGSAILDETPTFTWTPIEGATSYRITVVTEDLQPVTESPLLTATSWTPDNQLPRGKTLQWQVAAQLPTGEIVAPGLEGAEAKFHVLSESAARAVRTATRSNSHLARGLVYAKHGLLLDAEEELAQVADANPNSPVARALLADVRAKIPKR